MDIILNNDIFENINLFIDKFEEIYPDRNDNLKSKNHIIYNNFLILYNKIILNGKLKNKIINCEKSIFS